MIPILVRHDHTKPPVGWVKCEEGKLVVEFFDNVDINQEQFYEVFGNCGCRLLVWDDLGVNIIIRKAEVMEFSI